MDGITHLFCHLYLTKQDVVVYSYVRFGIFHQMCLGNMGSLSGIPSSGVKS